MPTWLGQVVSQAEYDRLKAHYEERAFERRPTQGQLCAPMVISDGQKPIMSMTNGQIYDSKSQLRKEYRRAGVVEVGNDVQTKRAAPSRDERERRVKDRKASVGRALSRAGFGAP
ncbi:hypothetical protein PXK58_08910 [Phaeobacter gallaeciensis]|uniref:hypothetical protein n=1 Tax=Phaeobacter gallaeciensis TaxID=60890 RepID=UPI00237FF6FF|nr:hypothetical protein [Phaeobacter gallaeciensis]MDE4274755.1 hypothetical protein [Phaeobacter gallaeciensis]MDE4299671.1 hypothetical protein [Phaeobacter gallaeciensis]MDE5184836.1 hypothetical protein [Phaeobacter gallaeciensis]